MRIVLLTIIILVAARIGLNAANHLKDIQDQRMSQFCQLDPKYCK
jgi:hypothetical protein